MSKAGSRARRLGNVGVIELRETDTPVPVPSQDTHTVHTPTQHSAESRRSQPAVVFKLGIHSHTNTKYKHTCMWLNSFQDLVYTSHIHVNLEHCWRCLQVETGTSKSVPDRERIERVGAAQSNVCRVGRPVLVRGQREIHCSDKVLALLSISK